jgi:cysteine-rich repeat protein
MMRHVVHPKSKCRDFRELPRLVSAAMRFGTLLALVHWAGCNQIAGIYEGERRGCSTVADCDVGVAGCRTAECKADECVYVDKPAGTLLEDQVVGDCQELQCDGQGRATIIALPTDHDDGNPCTDDSCVGSTPTHKALPFVACFTGPGVNRNQGICHDGRQECDMNGNLIGACIGEVLPAPNETCLSIYDDDCDGEINEASGDACICEKDTYRECYGSTVGSLGVGPCVSGFQKCMEGLFYGPCENQVTPKSESCATLIDDDCDGLVNEAGADCVCGDEIISSGEECDDGNKLDGDGCTSDCEFPKCGNGVMEDGEQCDDGNDIDADACTQKCQMACFMLA